MSRNTVSRVVAKDTTESSKLHAKERIAKGESVWAPATNDVRSVRQDAQGGDGGPGPQAEAVPESGAPADTSGPRIAVNPAVFHDKRDALCVAMNEAYRIIMEMNGFEPQAEPTEAQRRFFADTAYANDELQLRRTILARICTFDTSVQ